MQHIKDQIAALQKLLMGNSQDYSFGVISKAEYYERDQAISKQIGKLRDQLPSNFYSPEPTPGHYGDPVMSLRNKLLKEYNRQVSELRVSGIVDQSGHRNYGAENKIRGILTQALTKTDRARNLEVLQRIASDTAEKLRGAMPMNTEKKAA